MDAMTNIRINKELRDEIASLKGQLAECKKDAERIKQIAGGIEFRGRLRAFYMPEDLEDILAAIAAHRKEEA
jgi:hypothetical protein